MAHFDAIGQSFIVVNRTNFRQIIKPSGQAICSLSLHRMNKWFDLFYFVMPLWKL